MAVRFDDIPDDKPAAPRRNSVGSLDFDDLPTEGNPKFTPRAPATLGQRVGAFAADLTRNPLAAIGELATETVPRYAQAVTTGLGQAIRDTPIVDPVQRGAVRLFADPLATATDVVNRSIVDPISRVLAPGLETSAPATTAQKAQAIRQLVPSTGLEQDLRGARAAMAEESALEEAAIGARPDLQMAVDDPAEAARRIGSRILRSTAESAPALAGAVATRNPELGAALLGGTTGTSTYLDLIDQGVDRRTAAQVAALTGGVEAAGEQLGLENILGGRGLGGLIMSGLAEGGQEVPVQLAQTYLSDQATGQMTPISEQLWGAIEAFGSGAALGTSANAAVQAPGALSSLLSRPTPTPSPVVSPEPTATPAPTIPGGLGREATGDLDALIAGSMPAPPAAARGAGTPEVVPVAPAPIQTPEAPRGTQPPQAAPEPAPAVVGRAPEGRPVAAAPQAAVSAAAPEGAPAPASRTGKGASAVPTTAPEGLSAAAEAQSAPDSRMRRTEPLTDLAQGESLVTQDDGLREDIRSQSLRELGGEAAPLHRAENRVLRDSESVRDLLVGEAFQLHGLSGLDAPSQRVVLDHVVRSTKDPQVLRSVVRLLPVEVMDVLRRKQISPEDALRDRSVLQDLLSVDSEGSVSTAVDIASALSRSVAPAVAEDAGAGRTMAGTSGDGAAAVSTDERDDLHVGNVTNTTTEGNKGDAGEDVAIQRGLRPAVDKALGHLSSRVHFLNDIDGLPDRLLRGVKARQVQRQGRGKTAAVYDQSTGRVYLFNNANATPERAVFNAFHEIAGHHGLRELLGEKLDQSLGIARQNPTVKSVADAIAAERNLDLKTQRGLLLSTEEALAELAAATRTGNYDEIQTRYGVTVPEGARSSVKRAIDNFLKRLKAMLDDLFGSHVFTDEDVRDLLEAAWQSAEGRTGAGGDSASILEATTPSDRVREARGRAESRREEAAETLPVDRGTPGWNYDTGVWEGMAGTAKRARMSLQDKMTGWEDVQNQISSQVGEAIPDAQNVYQAENLMHGRVGEAINRLEDQQIKPLLAAMKSAKVSTEDLERYLYARHAEERNQQIAKINPQMPDGGSGMTIAQARDILANARPELAALANRVDAITRATRRRLLEHGLIDQATFDAMEAAYQHYVPLRGKREGEEVAGSPGGAGRGLDTRRAPTKRALGRGAGNLAENLLAEVFGDAMRSIVTAEKARVGRTVMRLVLANPNPDLWTVEPVQTERALDSEGQVYERVINDWNDPAVIGVRHNGKLYKVRIEQPELAQALNHVGVDQIGMVTRVAGAFNRYLSAMLTKYNPAFTGVNAVRDALFGLTGMAAEKGEGAALRAALKYPFAAASSFKAAHGKLGNSAMDKVAREFAEHGGKTGYVNMPSVEDIQRKIGSGKLGSYSPTGLARAATAIADQIEHVNDAVENALRLAAYATLRQDGVSPEQAATYAKNLTVNFNRKGLQGSAINSWFLFYNASIQGTKRFADVARKPKTWLYLGALATAQVVATMAMLGMEDDDGTPMWDKIPDHVKARNLVIPAGTNGFVTVPMPYGFNMMTWGAGRFTDAFARPKKQQNTVGKIVAETISNFVGAFSPVPLDDGALGLVPTVARIPLAVQVNRNNFGGQIRREDPYAKSDMPRASMGRPDTIELFKVAASGLNRIGGGNDYTPAPLSAFDRAPEDLQFIAEQLTGGAGRFVLDAARTAGTAMDPGAEVEPRKVPILGKFFANISEVDAQRGLYFDRREMIESSLRRVRTVARQDGVTAAQRLMASMPELSGARLKRNKGGGITGGAKGEIQFEGAPGSMFAAYKSAAKATKSRSEEVEDAYNEAPSTGLQSAKTRARDAKIRRADEDAMKAQRAFNAAWNKATDL